MARDLREEIRELQETLHLIKLGLGDKFDDVIARGRYEQKRQKIQDALQPVFAAIEGLNPSEIITETRLVVVWDKDGRVSKAFGPYKGTIAKGKNTNPSTGKGGYWTIGDTEGLTPAQYVKEHNLEAEYEAYKETAKNPSKVDFLRNVKGLKCTWHRNK